MQHLRRFFHPPRTIRPTREGWWFLLATLGLGIAASNTGNNVLYLLVSTLLALIVVSGVLSERSLRGLRLDRLIPTEIFARRPALLGLLLKNRKRRFATYSVALDFGGEGRPVFIPTLKPGQEVLLSVETRFPRRGRHPLPSVRLVTRFPFGLFAKSGRPVPGREVLVYPEVKPLAPEDLHVLGRDGNESQRRVGHGVELHNLRDYQHGDDPRLIHWKTSAKAERLVVRELEAESACAVRLELEAARGAIEPERLETAVSRAASLAAHLIGEGAQVALAGPGLDLPLGQGPTHLRRILEALALFDPARADLAARPPATVPPLESPVRVIRIPLGGSPAR